MSCSSRHTRRCIKIDNIDLGDLETLRARTGEDVFGENFQREFLTTIAFRQVDSFQFADYATAFKEEIERAVLITPEMDAKEITKAQDSLATLEKWGIRAEDGLVGAMQIYQQLSEADRVQFVTELEPVLTAMPAEVIARGSEALPQVTQQVEAILSSERSLTDAAEDVANTWSGIWGRIGTVGTNTLGILQEEFAVVFGAPILSTAERFFDFIASRQDDIRNFFTGIRDGVTPVVTRIWNTIREASPDLRKFTMDVWTELRSQWNAIAPIGRAVWETLVGIIRPVIGFVKEHPQLVATLITGIAAWKAYQLAANGVSIIKDIVGGAIKLTGGHIHRLNAMILENARLQGTFQTASMSASRMIGGIGRAALGAIPGIGAMGGSLIAAMIPALPVILPVIGAAAALGAAGYVVYRNWDGISDFFQTHFETIRNVLLLVFPPLGLLVGFAGVIRENWTGIKEMFSTIWQTVQLGAKVAFEFIQYVALSGLVFIKNAWAGITEFFAGLWQGVREFFVATPLAPIFEWMANGIKAVFSPLGTFFSDFWGNVSKKAGEVINWIIGKFKWLNDTLKGWLGWLRTENKKLLEELNITTDVKAEITTPEKSEMGIDIPEMVKVTPEILISSKLKDDEKQHWVSGMDAFRQILNTLEQLNENVGLSDDAKTQTAAASNALKGVFENIARGEQIGQTELGISQDALKVLKDTFTGADAVKNLDVDTQASVQLAFTDVAKSIKSFVPEVEKPAMEVTPAKEYIQEQMGAGAMPQSQSQVMPARDDLVNIALGQLSEMTKQTLLLEHLKSGSIQEVVPITTGMPVFESPQVEIDTPELVFEEYTLPSMPSTEQGEIHHEETQQIQSPQPAPISLNITMNIAQAPGEDAEALADRIASMVKDKLDEEAETYLVQ